MQAGIELGIPGKDAMQMAAYSMEGATELILNHNTHPLLEIEKVTTPGGTTIKGLNELEHKGFTSSIIQAIKSSATTLIDKEEEDAKISDSPYGMVSQVLFAYFEMLYIPKPA